MRRAPSGAQGVCKIAISSEKRQKIGQNPDFGPKFGHSPDWPDPAKPNKFWRKFKSFNLPEGRRPVPYDTQSAREARTTQFRAAREACVENGS